MGQELSPVPQPPVPPPGWQVGGLRMQAMPGPHWGLVLQLDPLPACTVTLKVTAAPPASGCTVTGNEGSAACVVSRNACASPPAPVGTVVLLVLLPLHLEFAAGGSVKRMESPAMDAPVSASSSFTLSAALVETPSIVVAGVPAAAPWGLAEPVVGT